MGDAGDERQRARELPGHAATGYLAFVRSGHGGRVGFRAAADKRLHPAADIRARCPRVTPATAAVRLAGMKIYTRTGDDGTTGLLGKARVPKHDARVEAYGSVDELNAVLGLVHAHDTAGLFGELVPSLQMQLFDVGAELATTDAGMLEKLARVGGDDITKLEREGIGTSMRVGPSLRPPQRLVPS